MASRKLEITVSSAEDLKNVHWHYGPMRSYAVLWVDGNRKCSTRKCCTRVDDDGDTSLVWNDTVVIPLPPGFVEDQTLYIDVRSYYEEDTKLLIGSAKLKLRDVIEEAIYGERLLRSLRLKLPSGKPHGKLKVKVAVKEPAYRRAVPYYTPPNRVQHQAPRRYASRCRAASPSRTAQLYRTAPSCRIAPPCRTAPPSRTAQRYRTAPPCRIAQSYRTTPPAYGNPYAPSRCYSAAPPSVYPHSSFSSISTLQTTELRSESVCADAEVKEQLRGGDGIIGGCGGPSFGWTFIGGGESGG